MNSEYDDFNCIINLLESWWIKTRTCGLFKSNGIYYGPRKEHIRNHILEGIAKEEFHTIPCNFKRFDKYWNENSEKEVTDSDLFDVLKFSHFLGINLDQNKLLIIVNSNPTVSKVFIRRMYYLLDGALGWIQDFNTFVKYHSRDFLFMGRIHLNSPWPNSIPSSIQEQMTEYLQRKYKP